MFATNDFQPSDFGSSAILSRFDAVSGLAKERARKSEAEKRFLAHCAVTRICGSALGYLAMRGISATLPESAKASAVQFAKNGITTAQKVQDAGLEPSVPALLACAKVANNTAVLMPTYFAQAYTFQAFAWRCNRDLLLANPAMARREVLRVDSLLVEGAARIGPNNTALLLEELFTPDHRAIVGVNQPNPARFTLN